MYLIDVGISGIQRFEKSDKEVEELKIESLVYVHIVNLAGQLHFHSFELILDDRSRLRRVICRHLILRVCLPLFYDYT